MIKVKNEGIILESSQNRFDNQAVLNPACLDIDGVTHMFYRGVRKYQDRFFLSLEKYPGSFFF